MSGQVMDIAGYDWPKIKGAVEVLLNGVKNEIIASMQRNGVNATGNASKSLKVSVEGVTGIIHGALTGCRYFSMPEVGRRNGKIPEGFTDIIYKWSVDKGINFSNDKERKRFSRAVAYTIRKYGSKQYRRGGRKTIYSQIVADAKTRIKENPSLLHAGEVTQIIKTLFRGNVTTTKIKVTF